MEREDDDAIIIQYHEATIKRLEKRIEELLAQSAQEPVAYLLTGPYEKRPFADISAAQAYCRGLNKGFGEDVYIVSPLYTTPPLPVQEQWNAALDEAASRIGEIKGFGKATQDSFAVYIKGLKK